MSGIFISYRRDDSAAYAGRLYDRLESHFGHDHIFMDIDHIEPGEDFIEVIQKKLGAVDVAIVMIGKQWLDITDSTGRRRLGDPDDFVRLEITAILERKIRVIPVLVGGAVVPKSSELPDSLAPLVRRHAFEISDSRFHSDVDKLIQTLEKVITKELAKAAIQGNADAQYSLGVRYDKGLGVTIDEVKAVEWYRKAAEQGHVSAQYNLGVSYDNGQGIVKDETKAVEWYGKAAEQGHARAQYNLGVSYENGQGATKDRAKALELYQKAAAQGHEKAQTALKNDSNRH